LVCGKNWFLGDNDMADDIGKDKAESEKPGRLEQLERLGRLGQLIDRYAQSRSLGLWAGAVVVVINTIVLAGSIELARVLILTDRSWWLAPIVFASLWVLISTAWLVWFEKKHGYSFYDKRDGKIEVEKERVAVWACAVYVITFLGPTFLSEFGIMPIRWAITMALTSFGTFLLYIGKKHKEKALGTVFGGLCLVEAAATALGVPIPLAGKDWMYSYFLVLNIYVVAAGLITMVVVHIYNRKILRKIKESRPFGEQEANKSDT